MNELCKSLNRQRNKWKCSIKPTYILKFYKSKTDRNYDFTIWKCNITNLLLLCCISNHIFHRNDQCEPPIGCMSEFSEKVFNFMKLFRSKINLFVHNQIDQRLLVRTSIAQSFQRSDTHKVFIFNNQLN